MVRYGFYVLANKKTIRKSLDDAYTFELAKFEDYSDDEDYDVADIEYQFDDFIGSADFAVGPFSCKEAAEYLIKHPTVSVDDAEERYKLRGKR